MKTKLSLWTAGVALFASTLTMADLCGWSLIKPKAGIKHSGLTKQVHQTDTGANARESLFLQDIKIYDVGGSEKLAVSYVPEPAASKVGYQGFKVGDKVKWDSPIDRKAQAVNGAYQNYLTGTVDLLDSDRCYIRVDTESRVAIKTYEDIQKINE